MASPLGGAASGAASGSFAGPIGTAIGAAAGLIGGLFSLGGQSKKRQQEALMKGLEERQAAEQQAAQTIGNQAPFQQLMNSYSFLGRKGM